MICEYCGNEFILDKKHSSRDYKTFGAYLCKDCRKSIHFSRLSETKRSNRAPLPNWCYAEVVDISDLDKSSRDKILWHCLKGHPDYSMALSSRLTISTGVPTGRGCPVCGKERQHTKMSSTKLIQRQSTEWPESILNEIVDANDLNGSSKIKVLWKCSKGHEWYTPTHNRVRLSDMTLKEGCPICAKQIGSKGSAGENWWLDFVHSLGVTAYKSVIPGTKYELDIYCPDFNLAIEYNGTYFHGTYGPQAKGISNKPERYHEDKFKLCRDKGIHLIQIWDWQDADPEIHACFERLIKHFLTPPHTRIGARKCEVRPIFPEECWEFCDLYHFQGANRQGKFTYGAYYNSELVAVMQFNKATYHSGVDYELSRYCVKEGYAISGIAEKLHSAFVTDYHPKEIISYSMNDWFDGSVYPRLGYTSPNFSEPGQRYYWVKVSTSESTGFKVWERTQCQLKNIDKNYPGTIQQARDLIAQGDTSCKNVENISMGDILGFTKCRTSGTTKWTWKSNN